MMDLVVLFAGVGIFNFGLWVGRRTAPTEVTHNHYISASGAGRTTVNVHARGAVKRFER